eukprot:g3018.t1
MVAGYAVYDWYVFDEANDVDNYEDEKSVAMCIGFGSLFMFITLAVEAVLGFCNIDDNKIWGGAFLFLTVASIAITLGAGGTEVETLENSNADDKYNNFLFYRFAIITAPIAYRTLLIFLKVRDMMIGGTSA